MASIDKNRMISTAELQFLLAATENDRLIEDGSVSDEDLNHLRNGLVDISQGQSASGAKVNLGLLDEAELATLRRVAELLNTKPAILLAVSSGAVMARRLDHSWLDPDQAEARFRDLQAVIVGGSQSSQVAEASALAERLQTQATNDLLSRLRNYAFDDRVYQATLRRQVSEGARPNSQALGERQKRLADRINRALANLTGVHTSEELRVKLEAGLGEGFAAEHAEIAILPALPKGNVDIDKTHAYNTAKKDFAARVEAHAERLGLPAPAVLEDISDYYKIRVPGIGDIVYFSLTTDPLESLVDSIDWTNIAFEARQVKSRVFSSDKELTGQAQTVDRTLTALQKRGIGIGSGQISQNLLEAVIAVMDSSISRKDFLLIDWKDQEPKIRALRELLQLKAQGKQISTEALHGALTRFQRSQPLQERASTHPDVETAMQFLEGENIRSPEAWERFISQLVAKGVVQNRETAILELEKPSSDLRTHLAETRPWQDRRAEFEAIFREGIASLTARAPGKAEKPRAPEAKGKVK
ncbi:MAG: hypothetical protein H7A32_00885 [Deltaproteobacteria bacterium]|nr:hypothetical protein [Deltaproteobacteria bacterium]